MIVNFLMRMMGLGKAVDALDGEKSKTYMGGVGKILTGSATLLGGAAGIVAELVAAQGGAAYFTIIKGITHDSNAGLVMAGLALIYGGIADIGQRHAIANVNNAVAETPTQPATPPPGNP